MRGRGGSPRRWRGALARLIAVALLAAPAILGVASTPAAAQGVPSSIGDDSVRIVFWPGDRPTAERALRTARAPVALPGIPEAYQGVRGTVILAPSEAVFDSLAGGAPGWSAGVAIPGLRLIILPAYLSPRTPLGDPIQALRHEIAHLALNAYLPGPIPRWFDEGYATWVAGGWGDEAAWRIRFAFLRGEGPALDSIALGWPRDEADARLAYLLSASAVQHLATRGTEQAFPALLRAWRRQGSLDAALRSTYLMTLGQFEDEWRKVVRNRYGWLLALSQIGAFWLALAILLVVVGSARRRSNRRRLAEMEAEYRMLPPPRTDGVDVQFPLE